MDFRIYYMMACIVTVRYTQACIEERRNCTFVMTCSDSVTFDWTIYRPGYIDVPYYCQTVITHNGNQIYPIELIYSHIPDREPVPYDIEPYYNNYDDEVNVKDVIYSINLSNLGYYRTPKLQSMQNLAVLNISRNNLNTAELSNNNELNMLTEIDLSYNIISIIHVNSYPHLYHQLKIINISHNRLGEIPKDVFDKFKYLQTLDLSYNYIDRLTQVTFEGVRKLIELNLSYNRLTGINSSLFRFSELQTLDISNNGIENLKLSDFGNLSNLQTLDVSYNMIKTIDLNAFNTLYLLENLNINNNLLEIVDKNVFASLRSLKCINLSNNKIKSLPMGMFNNSTILRFSITNNFIEGSLVKGVFDGINVTQLDLSHQFFTDIQDYAFYNLVNLEELFLDSNKIKSLSNYCFQTLVNLQHLDLSNNQIININLDTGDLTHLKSLLLKNNHITNIEFEQMQHLTNLEKLDISGNQITHFKPNSFLLLRSLINIKINDNQLTGVLEQDTFNGLILITTLNISHTTLTTIQNASFNNMNELKDLNMSRCSISELQYNVFRETGQIETLDLSYNKLIDFCINGTELHKLSSLFLNNNLIITISLDSQTLSPVNFNNLVSLDLSHNNIRKLQIGNFAKKNRLELLDLSYNKISFIQPGVFKDNTILYSLNVSHNNLSSISYGIFRGLNNLKILNMSYNNIKDLQSDRFFEIKTISKLIVDSNKIESLNIEEFAHTSLSLLSIGDNPLPCQILAKLSKTDIPFEISAIKIDEQNNENVNGVTCNKGISEQKTTFYNVGDNHTGTKELSNVLSPLIALNNNTNMLLNKIITLLGHIAEVKLATTAVPITHPTTNLPLIYKGTDINQIKIEVTNAIAIEKKNIINDIESKLKDSRTESLHSKIDYEKLTSNINDRSKYLLTETYISLVLSAILMLILVGFVLYKLYKSRMFKNRPALCTRELPGDSDISML